MISIRQNVFETNSSSSHSLVVCDNKTWEDFCNRKLYYNVLSRYHPEYLKKYPLDQYRWVPEDSCLNDLPVFCTFKQIKQHVSAYHSILSDFIMASDRSGTEWEEKIHRVSSDLLFLEEVFYSIDELEDYEYNAETQQASLDYYFG